MTFSTKSRIVIALALLIALAVIAVTFTPDPEPRNPAPNANVTRPAGWPNILLISLDTVRPDHLGCYGYPRDTSPNLDRLADRATQFTHAWATAPWTLPSHMSVFTSRLPSHHRVDSISRVLPEAIPTLTQLLQAAGYHTAALVNNGQMRAHWGFDRGFDQWREFEVDTPAGDCDAITTQASRWLNNAPAEPWLLFLHYYDPHDAYDAPEYWRNRFNVTLTGQQARQLAWRARSPDQSLTDDERQSLINAYDAEIAWLDHELGFLFAGVDDQTMIVVLTDHGEAFEEHGWTLHGATVYEEETRAALIIRYPNAQYAGREITTPVSLMDIAPTIYAQADQAPSSHWMGRDLTALIDNPPDVAPIIRAQTKAVIEQQIVRCAIDNPWKLIHSQFDNALSLYRLPDEHTDLAAQHPDVVDRLMPHIHDQIAAEEFHLLRARGAGKHELTINLPDPDARFGLFIPADFNPQRDSIEISPDGRTLRWITYPGRDTQTLYLEIESTPVQVQITDRGVLTLENVEIEPTHVQPRVQVRINDRPAPDPVNVESDVLLSAVQPITPLDRDGVSIRRFIGANPPDVDPNTEPLDDETLRHLRTLGYTR